MQRKPIFDFVRNLLGRGFRRAEIEALDSAIDAAIGTAVGPNRCHGRPMQVSEAGIGLIKRFEGCARVRPDGFVESSWRKSASGKKPLSRRRSTARLGPRLRLGPRRSARPSFGPRRSVQPASYKRDFTRPSPPSWRPAKERVDSSQLCPGSTLKPTRPSSSPWHGKS